MGIAASEGTNEWRIADGSRRQRVSYFEGARRPADAHSWMNVDTVTR